MPAHPVYKLLHTAVGQALKRLQAPQPISDEAIHDARKALKKARAVLRLLQDGIRKTTYQEENSAYGTRAVSCRRCVTPFPSAGQVNRAKKQHLFA